MTRGNGKTIGTRARRIEDPGLLRGRATFVDDIHLAGLLHAAQHTPVARPLSLLLLLHKRVGGCEAAAEPC